MSIEERMSAMRAMTAGKAGAALASRPAGRAADDAEDSGRKGMATSQRRGRIILKSRREIELMRAAGALVCRVLDRMGEMARPGVTTAQMNTVADQMIAQAGAEALFRGVRTPAAKRPFPAVLCTSVNEEVVHGVPSDRPLKEGDIVSVDCGVRLRGYCGDSARTFAIGQPAPRVSQLLTVTQRALEIAVRLVRPGPMWSEVAREIQVYVEGEGFTVVREFVGHGIGQEMWEEPKVPNYVDRKQKKHDFRLVEGLVLAIEPMVNIGSAAVEYSGPDRWAVSTKDRSYAAHFEHTVAVVPGGADVLTDGRPGQWEQSAATPPPAGAAAIR